MTEAEYKLAMIDADRATTSSYDYKSKVHFSYRVDKYCKIINKDEWNKPWIVEFDVEALRRDEYYPIPKHIKRMTVNIGHQGRGIEEYIHLGCMWGVDIFTNLLMDILNGRYGHFE